MIRLMKNIPNEVFIVPAFSMVLLFASTLHPASASAPAMNDEYYLPRATDSPKMLDKKGRECNKLHEYGFSIPLYEALLKRGGLENTVQACEGLGYAYAGKKQFPKAFEYLDKAVTLTRKSKQNSMISEAVRGRAKAHVENKEYELALVDMNESLKLGKSDGRWVERADILMQLKQYDKAVSDYSEAIKMLPENPQLYYARAKAWRFANKSAEATRDINKGNELSEKNF
jgi:tetratricopeptide (TPR) repeat protein